MPKPNPNNQQSIDQNTSALGVSNIAIHRIREARTALAEATRIAILTKFRFMGDTVVATPFIRQLRGILPGVEIDLLAAPCVVDALANCPYLDRIIPVNIGGVSRWQHGKDLHGLLKQSGYSVAFVLNRSLHCAVTAALSRIPVRIGYANEVRRFLLTVPVPYAFDRNEVDCHLDMLRMIGLRTEDALPDLWIAEAELEAAREGLVSRGWTRCTPVIGVQPGANDPYIREWGAERYALAAGELADEMGAIVIIMGGIAERETSERMAAAMKTPPINLVGELSLRDSLCTIGLCRLWLGNDTGLLHCAVAQRVASVGIFGPNKAVRWGYDSPRHRSLVSFPQTPADDDNAVRRCLDAISEDEVLETARGVLSAPNTEVVDAASPHAVATGIIERAPYIAATLSPAGAGPVRRR